MTVAELEAILARLPQDMLVMVEEVSTGWGTVHIEVVETHAARRNSARVVGRTYCETGRCETGVEWEGCDYPPFVSIGGEPRGALYGTAKRLSDDPPAAQTRGRYYWRAARTPGEVSA